MGTDVLSAKAYVVNWNRERGLLDKGFDPLLEMKMLSEEAREFFLAETLEHKLAEYADFLFVQFGTEAKYYASLIESTTMFSMERDRFLQLQDWMYDTQESMYSTLASEFSLKGREDLEECVRKALLIVIGCNNLKGTKTKDGKVVKNKEHINPVDKIAEVIYGG